MKNIGVEAVKVVESASGAHIQLVRGRLDNGSRDRNCLVCLSANKLVSYDIFFIST